MHNSLKLSDLLGLMLSEHLLRCARYLVIAVILQKLRILNMGSRGGGGHREFSN